MKNFSVNLIAVCIFIGLMSLGAFAQSSCTVKSAAVISTGDDLLQPDWTLH